MTEQHYTYLYLITYVGNARTVDTIGEIPFADRSFLASYLPLDTREHITQMYNYQTSNTIYASYNAFENSNVCQGLLLILKKW